MRVSKYRSDGTEGVVVQAVVDPNASTDSYRVGTVWVNTVTDAAFICVDNTKDTATWQQLTGDVGSGSGGTSTTLYDISVDTNAVKNSLYVIRANLTLTLPAVPTIGDTISFVDRSGTNTSIVNVNGNKIMGISENVTLDYFDSKGTIVYTGTTDGWVIVND